MDPGSTPKGAKCLKNALQWGSGVTKHLLQRPDSAFDWPGVGPLCTSSALNGAAGRLASAPAAVHDWLLIAGNLQPSGRHRQAIWPPMSR